jgi:hypothetical protein
MQQAKNAPKQYPNNTVSNTLQNVHISPYAPPTSQGLIRMNLQSEPDVISSTVSFLGLSPAADLIPMSLSLFVARYSLHKKKRDDIFLQEFWLLLCAHRHRSILGEAGHIILNPANQVTVMGHKIWSLSNPGFGPFNHWPNALTNCANRAQKLTGVKGFSP